MRKNVVKNIIKMVATTAMVATMFIGGSKMTVKADEIDELNIKWCAMNGITEDQFYEYFMDPAYADRYLEWAFAQQGKNYDEEAAKVVAELEGTGFFDGMPTLETMTKISKSMLTKVNVDRKNNGVSRLTWDAELETVARQRAMEIMDNVQTEEFEAARVSSNTAETNRIIHQGYTLKENAIVSAKSGVTAQTANNNWINSAGHHRQRIKAEWTKYACASYICPITGMEVWVEVFADNSFKGASSFDYVRYAKDYPDLAAAFGQDKNALYKHFITYGKSEGRKAYYTDGTAIKF